MAILSEQNCMKFDVHGNSRQLTFAEARGFVQGLQISAEKASLLFTEVVASRAIVVQESDGSMNLELGVWSGKGPFTAEQLLAMMQYPQGCLCDEWKMYVVNSSRLSFVH